MEIPAGHPPCVLVAAVAANGVIGHAGGMPWHLPADLRHFRALTMGHAVLMGRRTFDAIGKPLPGRRNIVLTGNREWERAGVTVVRTVEEAFPLCAAGSPLMVIGGGTVYRATLPYATTLEITEIAATPEGDTFFPPFDRTRWEEIRREPHPAEGGAPAFAFVTWQRVTGQRKLAPGPASR